MGVCSLADCDLVFYARGLCRMHYVRLQRHGTTDVLPRRLRTYPSVEERLATRTAAVGDCIEWIARRDRDGYGALTATRYGENKAHRVAYIVAYGPIPDGLVVRHKCDNPPCVKPEHLELGTHQDNQRDKVERGRAAAGENNPGARLTAAQVREIRSQLGSTTQRSLAIRYGVGQSTISRIARGTHWRAA